MADETISTRIVANADFSSLIADVHKVTASLSKLQEQLANSNKMMANQIAVMNRSFADTVRSTGQFSTHFVSLQSDVEKFGKNLDGGKLKLNQYFNAFRDQAKTSGGLIRDLAKQQVALQNAVLQPLGRNAQGLMQFNVHVPRGLDEVKNKTAIVRQELQIMNKVIQDGATGLINWGKNTQWAGRQLTVGLTVPLVAFGAQAAKAFREADQELVRLTKVYGDVAGTSAAELGKVRDQVSTTAKEISAAMGVSFKETIGLAADIAATGKTGDELLGSIKETTRLSVLGEVDRQEAMKATLAIQSAFKQNTEELSKSINFLNAVENQTSTTLNDLVEAIPKAGPVIQGLGGSIQDLALYLTAMREGGINASEGANALKSALASLINPTDVAVGKFQTLGIDLLGIVNNNAGNLTGTLMSLQGALDNLDPLQKQQAIEQLFGKFQFSRLNALFENLGRQGSQTLQVLDLMKASTGDLASVADRELAAVTESASGKYRRAIESLRASLAEVGEQFLTINTVLIQVIDKVVQFANNLPGPVKQILALAGGITAIIGPVIMLTGVLANFFGYLLKGAFHMKAFLKGGEGWKYLTPEMLAAEKAGKLVEQSFYSDAKAAAVLQQALRNLLDEFSLLEQKAQSGSIAVNPAVSTMAGNLVMGAGGRVVNPQHPLVGAMGSRASSHMVPRAGMTEEQRLSQTIFGMVPGSGPVNQKIGQNPQIYMNDSLPNVPGLTTIGGVSTGVVSGEAARWHSMMATLAMQSKAEIETLKKQIVATGVVSKDFMMQFDDILPIVSRLTDNAARESSVIVAELRAGKLTVESAKAKIIALNLETERMIASAVGAHAASMGRTINPTMVPTLNQPVVDAAGKSNMRELFKKGKTKDFINKIAGILGVRTSGAGYNIETTVPKRLNRGNIVPGTGNTDTVPAILTPGEFVVNKEATAANLPLLHAINGGQRLAGYENILGGFMSSSAANSVLRMFGVASRSAKPSRLVGNWGMMLPNAINRRLRYGKATGSELIPHISNSKNLIDVERFLALKGVDPSDIALTQSKIARQIKSGISPDQMYGDPELGALAFSAITPQIRALESKYPGISLAYQKDRMSPGRRDTQSSSSRHGPSPTAINVPGGRGSSYGSGSGKGSNRSVWAHFGDQQFDENIGMLAQGYNAGGQVGNVLKSTAFKNLGARFGKIGDSWGATSLSIGMGKKLFGSSGLTPKAQNLMYGKFIQNLEKERPYGYVKNEQGQLKNALEPHIVDILLKSAAGDVLSTGGKSLSKIDREILKTKFANWDSKSWTPSTSKVRKQMFGMNRGGMVPSANGQKYNMGGMVQGYNRGGFVKSILGSLALGYGGNMLGDSIGGGLGSAISMGSMIGSSLIGFSGFGGRGDKEGPGMASRGLDKAFGPNMAAKLKTPIGPLSGIANAAKGAGTGLSGMLKVFGPLLRGFSTLLKLTSPIGLALTGVTLAVGFLIKKHKEHTEELRINRAAFGMTADAAAKAGYKYTDYNKQIKTSIEDAKALKAQNKMIYESMTKANVPIHMTIEQYKKLKVQVKSTMQDYIKLFDQTDRKDVGQTAIQLKAQFMAAGDSAEVATAKIYALIDESNKAAMAGSAIGTKAFQNIQTLEQAAIQATKTFESALKSSDTEGQASSLLSAFAAINGSIDDTVRKSEDAAAKNKGSAISVGQATKNQIESLNSSYKDQSNLTKDIISQIGKANPELADVLNSTDTLVTAWAKYKLLVQGVNVDVKSLSGTAAIAAVSLSALVDTTVKTTGAVGAQYAKYGKLTQQIKDLEKAQRGQSAKAQIDSRDAIASLNKQIDKIKKAAEDKINGIRKVTEAENSQLEIQKAQLRAQQALATGNMTAYAEEQMSIEQILNESNRKSAEEAINLKAELDIKPLQNQIDRLGDKNQKLADKAALAGDSLGELQKKASTLNDNLTNYSTNLSNIIYKLQTEGDKFKFTDEFKNAMAALETMGKTIGIKQPASSIVDETLKALKNGINAQDVTIYTDKINQGKRADFSNGVQGLANMQKAIKDGGGSGPTYKPIDKNGITALTDDARDAIIKALGLEVGGEIVDSKGNVYKIKKEFPSMTGTQGVLQPRRALGGPVAAGQKYIVNDRVNSLGFQEEAFVPNVSGTIYPNSATMPRFNIPTGTKMSGVNISNSPSSNNVYNIDIDLNGTTVTADDVLNSFKRELALINAKEGINRRIGA